MKFSVVIPVYKNEASIPRLLQALSAMSLELKGEMEAVLSLTAARISLSLGYARLSMVWIFRHKSWPTHETLAHFLPYAQG